MEAGALWLLAVVLTLVPSSSSGQYVGLCEYRLPSLLSPTTGMWGPGQRGAQDGGGGGEGTRKTQAWGLSVA